MTQQETATTFGDWGKRAIAKHFRKIVKHESAVLEDQDPEELHQMRVGIRRLRSAMSGFALALNLPKKAGEKAVGKVGKSLGNLRDLDVLQLTLVTDYFPNLPTSEQKELKQVFKHLKKERKEAFKEVKSTLEGKHYQQLKKDLKDWLEKPDYSNIAAINIKLVLPDLLLPQVSHLLLHPGWLVGSNLETETNQSQELNLEQVEQLLEEQGETLHSLRKEAKKTRYNMALFTEFYGEQFQNYLEKIKNIQEILGTIQDCFILRLFLEQTVGEELDKSIPHLATQLQQKRYQKWQEWQSLQRQFLELSTRQDFQKTLIYSEVSELNN
ncbi:CHAD domain containing protein [Stanieria cyanosphaera PCC 7437]|uniref:CHAD domain containing protein n=1 Tax=Stanieria cyanosphaera (strain ATCC 29371 / PCC 7437) TaxID=111780 RepID=K9XRV8_STAC7|nr:CHAD domain-containing protein [Stanieria cyanosphaera]AFZ34412.1 CHAD domain containing protein [Stanieria cyanosphaera PCC 7437]